MTKNYIDANEKYVGTVTLYTKNSGDTFLYKDPENTTNINRIELMNLLIKGLVIISHKSKYHTPILFSDSGSEVTVTIATNIGASDSSAVVFKSKE